MTTRAASVKLESGLHDRLATLAKAKQRSAHFLMREAIANYVAREEDRLAFHEEAERAWTDYKETGLHVTLDDMKKWAKSRPGTPLPKWRK